MASSLPSPDLAQGGITAKRGLLSLELMRKAVSLIRLEKFFGGAWSWKRAEQSETGVLSVVEDMFCDLEGRHRLRK